MQARQLEQNRVLVGSAALVWFTDAAAEEARGAESRDGAGAVCEHRKHKSSPSRGGRRSKMRGTLDPD